MNSRIRFALPLLAAFALARAAAGSSCSPTLCTSAETLTLPDPSVFAAVADATGDGIPDVIVVTRQYGTVGISVLIGNGDGTFQAPVSTALDSTTPFFLTGDFNGDGKADVIVGDYSGGFVFLSVGDGTFQAPIPFDDGVGATSLAAAHLDSGSTLDLVAGGYNGVAVLRGNGDGTFQAAVVYSGSGATGVTTGDFDGDGKLDIGVGGGGGAAILRNCR